jgi:hypothetical protein
LGILAATLNSDATKMNMGSFRVSRRPFVTGYAATDQPDGWADDERKLAIRRKMFHPHLQGNQMKKHVLIAATAVALVLCGLSSSVFAAATEQASEHHQLSAEQIAAFTDAHIAALKAGLKLTPAQEKNWPALETALRDVAKDRAARAVEWREKAKEHHEKRDLIEGFRLGAKHLSARGAELEKIADAAKPLYDSLDDAQKHRFGVLLHEVFKHQDHHTRWGVHPDEHSDDETDGEQKE